MICVFDFAFCWAFCWTFYSWWGWSKGFERRLEVMLNYCYNFVVDKLLADVNNFRTVIEKVNRCNVNHTSSSTIFFYINDGMAGV